MKARSTRPLGQRTVGSSGGNSFFRLRNTVCKLERQLEVSAMFPPKKLHQNERPAAVPCLSIYWKLKWKWKWTWKWKWKFIVRYANGLSDRSKKPVSVSSNLTRTTFCADFNAAGFLDWRHVFQKRRRFQSSFPSISPLGSAESGVLGSHFAKEGFDPRCYLGW